MQITIKLVSINVIIIKYTLPAWFIIMFHLRV